MYPENDLPYTTRLRSVKPIIENRYPGSESVENTSGSTVHLWRCLGIILTGLFKPAQRELHELWSKLMLSGVKFYLQNS